MRSSVRGVALPGATRKANSYSPCLPLWFLRRAELTSLACARYYSSIDHGTHSGVFRVQVSRGFGEWWCKDNGEIQVTGSIEVSADSSGPLFASVAARHVRCCAFRKFSGQDLWNPQLSPQPTTGNMLRASRKAMRTTGLDVDILSTRGPIQHH